MMSPSDKKNTSTSSETANCSKTLDPPPESDDDVINLKKNEDHIPSSTANVTTLKCSSNKILQLNTTEIVKKFDPGVVNETLRLNTEEGHSQKNNRMECSKLKNYKAGSKINKLADMLAKRSQNIVEVNVLENNELESGIASVFSNSIPASECCEVLNLSCSAGKVDDVEDKTSDNQVVHENPRSNFLKTDKFLKINRRKSVPNQTFYCVPSQDEVVKINSKSCSDLSKLLQEPVDALNLSKKDSEHKVTSPKKGNKLKTSKKRRSPRSKKNDLDNSFSISMIDETIESIVKNTSMTEDLPSSQDLNETVEEEEDCKIKSKVVKKKSGRRKKHVLVESSTQTVDLTDLSITNTAKTEETESILKVEEAEIKSFHVFEDTNKKVEILEKVTPKRNSVKTNSVSNVSYLCLYCHRGFLLNASRKLHETRTHASSKRKKILSCQYCEDENFLNLCDLKTHLMKNHAENYFYCEECDIRFSQKTLLDCHTQSKHSKGELIGNNERKLSFTIMNKPKSKKVCEIKNEEFISEDSEKFKKSRSSKSDLKVDVCFDLTKKPQNSPRFCRGMAHDSRTEEQIFETEMLFYNQLSNNIQENLTNHLDGKVDKNGCPIRRDSNCKAQSKDPAKDSSKTSAALPVVKSNINIPVIHKTRSPSPYQTRSKTPNPLPTTAKKFKKLPNWQQKFWEKYNFPANYRYEHRFWDKNYLNAETSAIYMKDLCCLDIKTQITMRENMKKLEDIISNEDRVKNVEKIHTFPDVLSLMPKTQEEEPKAMKSKPKLDVVKIEAPKLKGRLGKSVKVENDEEEYNIKTRRKLSLDSGHQKQEAKGNKNQQIVTRHRSNIDLTKDQKKPDAGDGDRKRKGSLDMSACLRPRGDMLRKVVDLGDDSCHTSDMLDNGADTSSMDDSLSTVSDSGLAKITGEWVRPRTYLCGTCCEKYTNLWELEDHKWIQHPNVYCTHYEFEDEKIEKLFLIADEENINGNGKHKLTDLYKRYLLPSGITDSAASPPNNISQKCTKCTKMCVTLSELHKHILDCGGDTTWSLTMYSSPSSKRNGRKWRPFGSRRRRQITRQGVKRNIPNTPTLRSYNYQPRVRTKPGDGDSIQKMLANLPEKRIRRAITFAEIKTRSQATIHSNRLLRKRFKVPFGCGFIRNNRKPTLIRKPTSTSKSSSSKESSSKSNTDSSSESTPIASPKRRNLRVQLEALDLKRALPLLTRQKSSDSDKSSIDMPLLRKKPSIKECPVKKEVKLLTKKNKTIDKTDVKLENKPKALARKKKQEVTEVEKEEEEKPKPAQTKRKCLSVVAGRTASLRKMIRRSKQTLLKWKKKLTVKCSPRLQAKSEREQLEKGVTHEEEDENQKLISRLKTDKEDKPDKNKTMCSTLIKSDEKRERIKNRNKIIKPNRVGKSISNSFGKNLRRRGIFERKKTVVSLSDEEKVLSELKEEDSDSESIRRSTRLKSTLLKDEDTSDRLEAVKLENTPPPSPILRLKRSSSDGTIVDGELRLDLSEMPILDKEEPQRRSKRKTQTQIPVLKPFEDENTNLLLGTPDSKDSSPNLHVKQRFKVIKKPKRSSSVKITPISIVKDLDSLSDEKPLKPPQIRRNSKDSAKRTLFGDSDENPTPPEPSEVSITASKIQTKKKHKNAFNTKEIAGIKTLLQKKHFLEPGSNDLDKESVLVLPSANEAESDDELLINLKSQIVSVTKKKPKLKIRKRIIKKKSLKTKTVIEVHEEIQNEFDSIDFIDNKVYDEVSSALKTLEKDFEKSIDDKDDLGSVKRLRSIANRRSSSISVASGKGVENSKVIEELLETVPIQNPSLSKFNPDENKLDIRKKPVFETDNYLKSVLHKESDSVPLESILQVKMPAKVLGSKKCLKNRKIKEQLKKLSMKVKLKEPTLKIIDSRPATTESKWTLSENTDINSSQLEKNQDTMVAKKPEIMSVPLETNVLSDQLNKLSVLHFVNNLKIPKEEQVDIVVRSEGVQSKGSEFDGIVNNIELTEEDPLREIVRTRRLSKASSSSTETLGCLQAKIKSKKSVKPIKQEQPAPPSMLETLLLKDRTQLESIERVVNFSRIHAESTENDTTIITPTKGRKIQKQPKKVSKESDSTLAEGGNEKESLPDLKFDVVEDPNVSSLENAVQEQTLILKEELIVKEEKGSVMIEKNKPEEKEELTDIDTSATEQGKVEVKRVRKKTLRKKLIPERVIKSKFRWIKMSSKEVRLKYEKQKILKSYNRVTLKFFKHNKKDFNSGRQGKKLFTREYLKSKELLKMSEDILASKLPFLASAVKENPIQIIQCGSSKKAKTFKKGVKKIQRNNIQLRVSVPLNIIQNISLLNHNFTNNNHIEQTELEENKETITNIVNKISFVEDEVQVTVPPDETTLADEIVDTKPTADLHQLETDNDNKPITCVEEKIDAEITDVKYPCKSREKKNIDSISEVVKDEGESKKEIKVVKEEPKQRPRRLDVIDKIFYCEICQTYYYSASQLKSHILSNRHKIKELEVSGSVESTTDTDVTVEAEAQPSTATEPEDTSEMPILEGPFIEPIVEPTQPILPPSNEKDAMKELQQAIGCTDEEMYILTHLGEDNLCMENDILDLDAYMKTVKQNSEKTVERKETTNGVQPLDLKAQMTTAMEKLVSKAISQLKVNPTRESTIHKSETVSFLMKLTQFRHKYECTVCACRFEKASTCRLHMSRLHGKRKKEVPEEVLPDDDYDNCSDFWGNDGDDFNGASSSQFSCSGCGITFQSPQEVLNHQKAEHQASSVVVPETSTRPLTPIDKNLIKRRGRFYTPEEIDKQRAIATSELMKLEKSSKKPQKWGMDALKITLEKENSRSSIKPVSSTSDDVVSEKTPVDSEAKIQIIPNLTKTNIPEFKLVQKNSTENRFQKLLDSKNLRKSNRLLSFSSDLNDLNPFEEEEEVDKLREKHLGDTKTLDVYDFNDSESEGEPVVFSHLKKVTPKLVGAIQNPNILKLVKESKKEPLPKNTARKIKEPPRAKKPKPSFDVLEVPVDYDSDDNLPLAAVKKTQTHRGIEHTEAEKTTNFEIDSKEELSVETTVEEINYLPEPLGHSSDNAEATNSTNTSETGSSTSVVVDTTFDEAPLVIDNFKIKLESKYLQLDYLKKKQVKPTENLEQVNIIDCLDEQGCSTSNEVIKERTTVYPDEIVTQDLEVTSTTHDIPRIGHISDEEDSLPLVLMSSKKFIPPPEPKDDSIDNLTIFCSIEKDVTDMIKPIGERSQLHSLLEPKGPHTSKSPTPEVEESFPTVLSSDSDAESSSDKNSFQGMDLYLDGNIILHKNDSSSSISSDSEGVPLASFGRKQEDIISSSFERPVGDEFQRIVTEKEDVVIVCTKKDEHLVSDIDSSTTNSLIEKPKEKKRRRSLQKRMDVPKKKKKIVPSLSATIEDSVLNPESPKSNKEEIVKKIWSRRKVVEDSELSIVKSGDDSTVCSLSSVSEPTEISRAEVGKDMIMKRIWSRKKLDVENKDDEEEEESDQRNMTEVSNEIVIKCGPKPKPIRRKSVGKRPKKPKLEEAVAKNTIMRRIWSGKCLQTKAALKTYDDDIQPIPNEVDENSSTESSKIEPPEECNVEKIIKKRGRPQNTKSVKKKKSEDENSSPDDLDSLLDEIEREDIEKAFRLEFLKLRRSDNADNLQNYDENKTIGLFSENLKTQTTDIIDRKKKRKQSKKVIKRITKPLENGSSNTEDTDVKYLGKIKNRKHKKHRHKHHHKHKHKKSKHSKCIMHKHKKEHEKTILEKMCEKIPNYINNEISVSDLKNNFCENNTNLSNDLDNLDKLDQILSPFTDDMRRLSENDNKYDSDSSSVSSGSNDYSSTKSKCAESCVYNFQGDSLV